MTKESRKKLDANKLFSQLPKSFAYLDVLHTAMHLVKEAQKHATDVKKDASVEALKLFMKLQDSYHDMSARLSDASDVARKQAQERLGALVTTWNDRKSSLPNRVTSEVDDLLGRLGLDKVSKRVVVKTATVTSKKSVKTSAKASAKKSAVKDSKPKAKSKMPVVKVPSAKVTAKTVAKKPAAKKATAPAKTAAKKKVAPKSTAKPATTVATTPASETQST